MTPTVRALSAAFLMTFYLTARPVDAAAVISNNISAIVSQTVLPLMTKYGIPGMTVGLTINGMHYVYNFGIASRTTRSAVNDETLFEIGSITKTFTATLASYAELTGHLSLSDNVSSEFPSLRGTSFDHIRLLNLGTHTAGGLPLQLPDDVTSNDAALTYYKQWKPSHDAGTYRLYSNPSIMLLGLVTAQRLHEDFVPLMQRIVFRPLRLTNTFLILPGSELHRYAEGYTDTGSPHRMSTAPLEAEAYGVRTSASDMLRFVDANLGLLKSNTLLGQAIASTHVGYYKSGSMTQDLIWEQYRYPISMADLLKGNSAQMMFEDNRVATLVPPAQPGNDVFIDKTGSTGGFGAYVAFIPRRKTGIVLFANRSYPIAARVTTAYEILARLSSSKISLKRSPALAMARHF